MMKAAESVRSGQKAKGMLGIGWHLNVLMSWHGVMLGAEETFLPVDRRHGGAPGLAIGRRRADRLGPGVSAGGAACGCRGGMDSHRGGHPGSSTSRSEDALVPHHDQENNSTSSIGAEFCGGKGDGQPVEVGSWLGSRGRSLPRAQTGNRSDPRACPGRRAGRRERSARSWAQEGSGNTCRGSIDRGCQCACRLHCRRGEFGCLHPD